MSAWWLALAAALFLGAGALLHAGPYPALLELGATFDEVPAADVDDAYARVVAFGDTGRALYRAYFRWDAVFLLANGAALALALATLVGRAGITGTACRTLLALPFVTVLADFTENFAIARMFDAYEAGDELARWAGVAAMSTRIKFFSFTVAGMGVLWLAFLWFSGARDADVEEREMPELD